MDIGWQIRHQRFGWGVVTSVADESKGRVIARFADGEDRHVKIEFIVERRAPQQIVVPPQPPPMVERPPARRFLQERKDEINRLLDEGKESLADEQYAQTDFGNFWPSTIYEKRKQDTRRHFRNEIREYAAKNQPEEARSIRQERCAEWMTDDEFAACVRDGLIKARNWQAAAAWPESTLQVSGAVLASAALAIDLESDGDSIWEVGYACRGTSALLYGQGVATELDAALEALHDFVDSSPLLVGHNILAWDWPILAPRLGMDSPPLIWDTLLTAFLLEPQAASHALGGMHHADSDAQLTLKPFKRQLNQLPPEIARAILAGDYQNTVSLMNGIAESLSGNVRYARQAPNWLRQVGKFQDRILLMPEHMLREFDWVPDAVVVSVDDATGLGLPWRQINSDRLAQELDARALATDAAASAVLTVARRSDRQQIALRRRMIPTWLTERDPALGAAIDAACELPDFGPRSIRCALVPKRLDWWREATSATYAIVGPPQTTLVVDRTKRTVHELAPAGSRLPAAHFMRIVRPDDAPRWVVADRALQVLEPGGCLHEFVTFMPQPDAVRINADTPSLTQRPVFLERTRLVLHPHANDQGAYWIDVLRTVMNVTKSMTTAVPLLLVGSTTSRTLIGLLETALAELGLGSVRPAHRSKREHLRNASRDHHVLVDTIDHWPEWRAMAESLGLELQPIVEALPLEEWYACAYVKTPTQNDARQDARPGMDAMPIAVSDSCLLEELDALLQEHLQNWLLMTGIASNSIPAMIIDPRVGAAQGRALSLFERGQHEDHSLDAQCLARLAVVFAPFNIQREEPPADVEAMEAFLVEHWQPRDPAAGNRVEGFKPAQREAMKAICARNANVLVSLPTGEGKSVLFQVPALCRGLRNRRLTLVLSPLKALMRDQVERLRDQGFAESADYLSGDRSAYEVADVLQGVMDHRIVLLYVAPERLRSRTFLDVLERRICADGGLEHVVVDETHCVNQWGHEFRPDYYHALEQLQLLVGADGTNVSTPFILLSATTTASDRACLSEILSHGPADHALPLPLVVAPEEFNNPLRSHIVVEPTRVRGTLHDDLEFANALAERLPFIKDVIDQARRNRERTGQRSAVLVFVSSREHAEKVAREIHGVVGGGVDYYHAGLDSSTRNEIYEQYLQGRLDVLVATKAFGMGMDIPDIHWIVHLSPPAYLEDYLQEVGRLGRGNAERERAGLGTLRAVLLFSDRDFESIRSLRVRNALSFAVARDLHTQILDEVRAIGEQHVAIVPAEGFVPREAGERESKRRAKATGVRMSLYWLERAGKIRVLGAIPGLLTLTVHHDALARVAAEQGPVGEVARLIQGAKEDRAPQAEVVERADEGELDTGFAPAGGGLLDRALGVVGRLFMGLAECVGLMIGVRRAERPMPAQPEDADVPLLPAQEAGAGQPATMLLNLLEVRSRCEHLKSNGDVFARLVELQRLGAVELDHEVHLKALRLASEPSLNIEHLFTATDNAVSTLIEKLTSNKGSLRFNPQELFELDHGEEFAIAAELQAAYERAFVNGFRALARASGVRMRQIMSNEQEVVWEATLAPADRNRAHQARDRIKSGARALFRAVHVNGEVTRSCQTVTLIEAVRAARADRRFSIKDFKLIASLLSALNLLSFSPELLPLSYLVEVPNGEGANRLDEDAEVWKELLAFNEMAEARNLAMEVFSHLQQDGRDAFIRGYFDAENATSLRAFIDEQVGNIDEDFGGEVILAIRERLRATRATQFFQTIERSEEPVQWDVVRQPYDRHLLVNAGPGAGKTYVLVGRIAHLIRHQQIDPAHIIVLAFNRAVVFEIKRRIRSLFQTLGYGAYAARLRVYTFHAFALRNLRRFGGGEIELGDLEDVLPVFAQRMEDDPDFRQAVAGNARCILVDEFQDVTESVYAIVRNLHLGSGSRAGVMVIGDDDQDILRWQRLQEGGQPFAANYFQRFEGDFADHGLSKFLLRTNFRSAQSIVQRSQTMLAGFFARRNDAAAPGRIKNEVLQPRAMAEEGQCTCYAEDMKWDRAIAMTQATLHELNDGPESTLAILCRTNAEVVKAHCAFQNALPTLSVHGSANLRIAQLRHVGLWLDRLRTMASQRDAVLSEELWKKVWREFRDAVQIPEVSDPRGGDISIEALWKLCMEERPFPHLSTLIEFVDQLRMDEYDRMTAMGRGNTNHIVSTIHKVKGLEFDDVIILPSESAFGIGEDIAGDAAEEARLLYVGMTRAKHRLWYFVGGRERAWEDAIPQRWDGGAGDERILQGRMDEVWLGWAMTQMPFNPDPLQRQQYIESRVAVGDPIQLGGHGGGAGRALLHGDGTQIGYLANEVGAGGPHNALTVSAVVRFRLGDDDEHNAIPQVIVNRGWGYAVLVSGRLR